MTQLDDWSVVAIPSNDPYGEPKQGLRGRLNDGTYVRTSPIKHVNGCEITTKSDSIYHLGTPSPEYVAWCQQNGCHVPTPEEPIKCLT